MQFGALVAMTNALESSFTSALNEEEKLQILSASMIVAATWILHAGTCIYAQCSARGEEVGNGEKGGKGGKILGVASDDPRWNGEGFSLPRWRHWKERFRMLAETAEVDERSRGAAVDAAARMAELDRAC